MFMKPSNHLAMKPYPCSRFHFGVTFPRSSGEQRQTRENETLAALRIKPQEPDPGNAGVGSVTCQNNLPLEQLSQVLL